MTLRPRTLFRPVPRRAARLGDPLGHLAVGLVDHLALEDGGAGAAAVGFVVGREHLLRAFPLLALGLKTSLTIAIWPGWIVHLPSSPSARASAGAPADRRRRPRARTARRWPGCPPRAPRPPAASRRS